MTPNDTSISVAMCTFNGGRFLSQQLEGIRHQICPPDELVICDDGSTDASLAIAANFAVQVGFRVRVIRNDRQIGSTRNFENAISLCRSSIIALADQDDVWYPHKLARVEHEFRANPSAIAVFSDADLVDSNGYDLRQRLWNSFRFCRGEQKRFASGDFLGVLIKHPVVTGATLAFRRTYFDRIAPIPANQMHDTWIAFLLACSGKVVPIEQPLMQYRQHPHQQIGPGESGLQGRFARARQTGSEFYLEEIDRFHQLAERLEQHPEHFPHATRALEQIHGKIAHRSRRASMPSRITTRIPVVITEFLNGGYRRYSEGWQSFAKDLFGLNSTQSDPHASAAEAGIN